MKGRVPTRDYLVAASAGLTLAYAAWGLGGIPTWSLHILLAGGVATLALALCPLPRREQGAGSREQGADSVAVRGTRFDPQRTEGNQNSPLSTLHFPLQSLKRLARWPPFWLSLAFLIYLLIGALNPAAQVVADERGWWVEAIPAPFGIHLPTSVTADYQPMNAWRVLASFTAAFTLIWGLWAGVTRRKAILLTLWSFLLSGATMGLVGILQHLTEAEAVLWHFPSSNPHFWGSFFYRNQGTAFLNLVLIAAGVLFFYHAQKTHELSRSGGPHFLCFLLFATVATSVGLALSRGGILFAAILSLIFLGLVVIYALQSLAHLRSFWLAVIPLALLVIGAVTLVRYVDLEAIDKRFGDIEATIENADRDARAVSTRATWDMAQDRIWLGWGAGSFRYIFPMYQQNYPEIFYSHYHKKKGWIGRRAYRYAHNDLVQFVAEYGLIGSGLVALTVLSMLASALRVMTLFPLPALYLSLGCLAATAHAFLDFIFNSPAYWIAFVGLITATAKLLRLEAAHLRRR